jgi:hypothetical protein
MKKNAKIALISISFCTFAAEKEKPPFTKPTKILHYLNTTTQLQ